MPRDFTEHMAEQENSEFGLFLVHAIAAPLGLADDPKAIDRAVYKGTACGAWCQFDAQGIMVGTIVEGSDAEYSERVDLVGIDTDAAGEAELNTRFWAALQRCEDFADEHFESDEHFEADEVLFETFVPPVVFKPRPPRGQMVALAAIKAYAPN